MTTRNLIKPPEAKRRGRGFEPVARFLRGELKKPAYRRGMAATEILANWVDVVGKSIGELCTAVDLSFNARTGDVVLTVLTTGALAQEVEMSKPLILERVNARYGFDAIGRIRITQTWKEGFAPEPSPCQKTKAPSLDAEDTERIAGWVGEIESEEMRASLAKLGAAVLKRTRSTGRGKK